MVRLVKIGLASARRGQVRPSIHAMLALFLAGCHDPPVFGFTGLRDPEARTTLKAIVSTYSLAELKQCFGTPQSVRPLGKFKIASFSKEMCLIQATVDGEHVVTVDARFQDSKVCLGHIRRSCQYR
jgi:hypothetical protein